MKRDKIDDGGPAFSQPAGLRMKGMSLLDYFAGQALAGMCANAKGMEAITSISDTGEEVGLNTAIGAYAFADFMIAQRKEKS